MKITKKAVTLIGALALLIGLAGPTYAGDKLEFIRFKKGATADSGKLQIAQASYTNPKTKVKIILYGVVHIADKSYYKAVQKDLDGYDVVLWEGIKPGKKKVLKPTGGINISLMQKVMCNVLGLTFQKDGIDYNRKNFVWADMTMDELQAALGNKPAQPAPQVPGMINPGIIKQLEPFLKQSGPFIKAFFKIFPTFRNTIKLQFANQLANSGKGGEMPGMDKKFMKVILYDRNKVVMKFLNKQLKTTKKGDIAIFYGAAHMADLDGRLAKLGYTQTGKKWKTAWDIKSPAKK